MATASQTAPYNIQVTAAPDIMDLHSDSGFDFGDGDIDLDLRSTGQQDEDLSIHDAGTDAGLEVQTVPGDPDDFMVDNEDVIEEDMVNYNDDDVAVIETDEQELVNNEDDLIDYSDDEEQTMWNDNAHVSDPVETEMGENQLVEQEDEDRTAVETPYQAVDNAAPEEVSQRHDDDASQHGETNHGDETRVNDDDFQEFAQQQEDKPEGDEDATTYIEPSNGEVKENKDAHGQVDISSNAHDDATLNEHSTQVQQEVHIHPVTVNYDSVELWLFKHHDFEDSGDFLVEDENLARKPLSNLLDACRVALGSDVTEDIELGFRLDNFHNIELYQEHSSCAFITLEHLANLYLQLHIQDGVSSPESFYMTLLFRPRVSALLNELSKAATEGIGHLGLERAISAGLTAFNAHWSHNSTEHILEDWENGEEQQEQDAHGDHELSEQAEQVGENEERTEEVHDDSYEEHDEEYHPEQYEESHVEERSQPEVQNPDNATFTPAANSIKDDSAAADDRSPVDNAEGGAKSPVARSQSNSAQVSPTSQHDEDDLIDYSDDEADSEVDRIGESQAHQLSSSSSTVQGDNTSYDQNDVEALTNQDDLDETDGQATHSYEGETHGNLTEHEERHSAYEGFNDQTLGDEYNDENDQARELGITNVEELAEHPTGRPTQTNNEDTNQYDDFEHGNVDQAVNFSLAEFEDDNSHTLAQSTAIDDKFAGVDDFLDFPTAVTNTDLSTGGQAGSVNGEDDIEYDDEDGAAGQAPVAASAAAEPVDTLSSELLELSPQGQKRTIDEVAIDVGEATDISDAKRPRV